MMFAIIGFLCLCLIGVWLLGMCWFLIKSPFSTPTPIERLVTLLVVAFTMFYWHWIVTNAPFTMVT